MSNLDALPRAIVREFCIIAHAASSQTTDYHLAADIQNLLCSNRKSPRLSIPPRQRQGRTKYPVAWWPHICLLIRELLGISEWFQVVLVVCDFLPHALPRSSF